MRFKKLLGSFFIIVGMSAALSLLFLIFNLRVKADFLLFLNVILFAVTSFFLGKLILKRSD